MRAFRIRVFVPHSNDDMGPRVAREHEKNMQVQSKDILVVKNLRKEVHCSMQIIVHTRWVIKATRGCTKSLWSCASERSAKAIKLRNSMAMQTVMKAAESAWFGTFAGPAEKCLF